MPKDSLDRIIEQWESTRPDVDAAPMAVVGRVLRLAGYLERRANEALKPLDLPIWGFDVLGTLQRSGSPYALPPSELSASIMLTSGAMTNRIDRLEKLGLVSRCPSSSDRRSLLVQLTAAGKELVDSAVVLRFAEAAEAVEELSAHEQKQLSRLLRRLLLKLEPDTADLTSNKTNSRD